MEFNFETKNESGIAGTIAFALYEDGGIGIADAGKPLSVYQLSHVAGAAIKAALAMKSNNVEEDTYVDRRDAAHEIVRMFSEALDVDVVAAGWRKADNELPKHHDDILFTLKDKERSDTVYFGYYDTDKNMFIDVDVDGTYTVSDVDYWMFKPEAAGSN